METLYFDVQLEELQNTSNMKQQIFKKQHLPSLDNVILKVKQLQDLTPEEELVYYTQIENIPEEEAKKILANSFQSPPKHNYSFKGSWITV